MEVAITLVLTILYDWMRKLEIEVWIISGGKSVPKDTPSP